MPGRAGEREDDALRTVGGLTAGMVMIVLSAMAAQPDGDPAAGRELANELCTACHIVGTEPVGSDVAPPFPAIAADPEMTLSELHAWVEPAHPVLPRLPLTSGQIADINAYLDSLRERGPDPAAPENRPRVDTEAPPPAILESPPEKLGPPITAD